MISRPMSELIYLYDITKFWQRPFSGVRVCDYQRKV